MSAPVKTLMYLSPVLCCLANLATNQSHCQARKPDASMQVNSPAMDSLMSMLQEAPDDVKEYYRITDSLSHVTSKTRPDESWSTPERHKYAYLLYKAKEYDPVLMDRYNRLRYLPIEGPRRTWFVGNRQIVRTVEDHDSNLLSFLVDASYLYSIVVQSLDSVSHVIAGVPRMTMPMVILHCRITKVWKGKKYGIGDRIDGFTSSWYGCRPPKKGSANIIAFFVMDPKEPVGGTCLVIGGAISGCSNVVYPVDSSAVHDENNTFGLGTIVTIKEFENGLRKDIETIESWK